MTIEEIVAGINALTSEDRIALQPQLQAIFPEISANDIAVFLDTDKGKQLVQSKIDSGITKGVETYRNNNFETEVDKEVGVRIEKLHPTLTDEQKERQKDRARIDQLEQNNHNERLRNKALVLISNKKLPFVNIIDRLIGKDEVETTSNITAMEDIFNSEIDKRVIEKIKGRDVVSSPEFADYKDSNPWDAKYFNLTRQGEVLSSNPILADKLKKAAGH